MSTSIKEQMRAAAVALSVFTVLTGVVYPLAMTCLAQVLFTREANGSLVMRDGKAVGSELIGQPWSNPRYFWSRPSATPGEPYNASASSGSNLGPTNPALFEAVTGRVQALRAADPGNTGAIPVDLVTASGSGLDPHISPAAAAFQMRRVARARGLQEIQVSRLVLRCTEDHQWGVLGEPRVNVLRLNLELDSIAGDAERR